MSRERQPMKLEVLCCGKRIQTYGVWSLWCQVAKFLLGAMVSFPGGNLQNQPTVTSGPSRPLRRFLQGLDPRATANLFIDAVCIGEKAINKKDCFILKVETSQATLDAQSGPHYEIIHHTLWGYFCQRSGLLLQLEDSRMLTMKSNIENDDGGGVFWEMSAESVIEDYKYVDGINIAHSGKTSVRVFRYGEQSANHQREIDETWKIDEVGFNIWGLDHNFFMPPSDIISSRN